MTRVFVVVEGQTEEAFTREVLCDVYASKGVYLIPILIETSSGHKGGVPRFSKVKPQIERLLKQESGAYVTSLLDYYALPPDFPGQASVSAIPQSDPEARIMHLERQLGEAIGNARFIPNLMLHEFEALLFTDIEVFSEWVDRDHVLDPLRTIRATMAPEEINDSVHTAPSKRILDAWKNYQKTFHGPLIANAIGLDAMRAACPHFRNWLNRLDALSHP